jgi:Fe-S-cluster containining protein
MSQEKNRLSLLDNEREDFAALVDAAGDAKEVPPDPKGGVPKQWLPGFIRWPIRILFLPFVLLDIWSHNVAKFFIRPPNKQEGACLKRGNCCHYILLEDYTGWKGAVSLFWNTQINGFFLRDTVPYECDGRKVLVLGCRYLSKKGSCTRYKLRPAVCRKWPLIEYFGKPRMLKGCGFRAKSVK